MTALAHDPQPQEDFDLLQVLLALEIPEGYRAELIDGEIVVSTPPRGAHESIIGRLVKQFNRKSAIEALVSQNKGLMLPGADAEGPGNYVIPDATLVAEELDPFWEAPSWMRCEDVLLVAEITSSNPQRDRVEKRHCYARAGIPCYLLVDRDRRRVTLFTDPVADDYQATTSVPCGKPLPLPEPFSFDLDTTRFC